MISNEIIKPNNLFKFATSELSQDAFLCWLLNWLNNADQDFDTELANCAEQFLQSIFAKADKADLFPKVIERPIQILQQWNSIDVLVILNSSIAIIIEDKTNTKNHGDQLNRYKESVENAKIELGLNPNSTLIPIYFKTGNQSDYSEVKESGYTSYLRTDFLKVLSKCNSDNSILTDFYQYLSNIENETISYKEYDFFNWSSYMWEGFLMELKERIDSQYKNWKYVNNPAGGFWCFHWNWIEVEQDVWIYMQLELDDNKKGKQWLCLKVEVGEKAKENRSEIRNKLFKISSELYPDFDGKMHKPNFGKGKYMTFWIHNRHILREGQGENIIADVIAQFENPKNLLEKVKNEYISQNNIL